MQFKIHLRGELFTMSSLYYCYWILLDLHKSPSEDKGQHYSISSAKQDWMGMSVAALLISW